MNFFPYKSLHIARPTGPSSHYSMFYMLAVMCAELSTPSMEESNHIEYICYIISTIEQILWTLLTQQFLFNGGGFCLCLWTYNVVLQAQNKPISLDSF